MQILLASDLKTWDNWLVAPADLTPFTQTSEWGNILIAEGGKVERLAIEDEGVVVAQAQVEYRDLPLGWRYGFCPNGPVFAKEQGTRNKEQEVYKLLNAYLENQRCLFFRIDPSCLLLAPCSLLLKTKDINPRATTILGLHKTEAQFFEAMHAKTRYNIRLAEKKGVEISVKKDLPQLLRLSRLTGERDGFRLHEEKHYRQVLESDMTNQLSAVYQGKTIATMVTVAAGNTLTYLYGASDHAYRAVMAPALLQWRAIQMARAQGYGGYDFFGIAPNFKEQGTPLRQGFAGQIRNKEQVEADSRFQIPDSKFDYDPKHQYAGVTRFKLGFGGVVREGPGTHDLILNAGKYRMYGLLRKIRRLF